MNCPNCQGPIQVQTAEATPNATQAEPQAIVCPDCGTKFAYRAELIGQTVPCSACGTSFTAGEQASADYTFAGASDPLGSLLDDDPLGLPDSPVAAPGATVPAPPKSAKKKKKKKKKGAGSGFNIGLPPELVSKLVAAVGVAGFLLLLLVLGGYAYRSLPGNQSHGSLYAEAASNVQEICTILEAIHDEQDVSAAVPQVKTKVDRLIAIDERLKSLGKPAPGTKTDIDPHSLPQYRASLYHAIDLTNQLERIPGAVQQIQPILKRTDRLMALR